jgi:cytochrome c biogenesis protein CcmG/thiol:disulfide interchange protein DsbE
MNWRNAAIAGLLTLPLIVVLASGFGVDPHAVPNLLLHKPAPAFELTSVEGKPLSLENFSGKPLLLNFWSTWCEPCKAEHEMLQQAAKYYGDQVQFLGIVYQDEADAVTRYLKARSNNYPQAMDPGSRVAMDFGVAGVPESFIIDAQGQVAFKQAGVITGPIIQKTIDPLLGKVAQP